MIKSERQAIIIALVDDTEEDLYINNRIIQKHSEGIEVLQFNVATEAMHYFELNKDNLSRIPDILLLDLHMPPMNGFEFLDEYDRLPQPVKAKCKIYLVSSSIDPSDMARAKNNGNVFHFFEKPLTKEILEKILL